MATESICSQVIRGKGAKPPNPWQVDVAQLSMMIGCTCPLKLGTSGHPSKFVGLQLISNSSKNEVNKNNRLLAFIFILI